MAQFVKAVNGSWVNIDHIILIDNNKMACLTNWCRVELNNDHGLDKNSKIIPAEPGWQFVWVVEGDQAYNVYFEPIVAWELNGGPTAYDGTLAYDGLKLRRCHKAIGLTNNRVINDEPDPDDPKWGDFLLKAPDGRIVDIFGNITNQSVEDVIREYEHRNSLLQKINMLESMSPTTGFPLPWNASHTNSSSDS